MSLIRGPNRASAATAPPPARGSRRPATWRRSPTAGSTSPAISISASGAWTGTASSARLRGRRTRRAGKARQSAGGGEPDWRPVDYRRPRASAPDRDRRNDPAGRLLGHRLGGWPRGGRCEARAYHAAVRETRGHGGTALPSRTWWGSPLPGCPRARRWNAGLTAPGANASVRDGSFSIAGGPLLKADPAVDAVRTVLGTGPFCPQAFPAPTQVGNCVLHFAGRRTRPFRAGARAGGDRRCGRIRLQGQWRPRDAGPVRQRGGPTEVWIWTDSA